MQLIAVLRRRTESFAEQDFAGHLAAEALRVRELYQEGFIRSAWSRQDVLGACLLLEASSAADAQAKLQTLPLAAAGMLEAQIIPLRGYRGFCP
ncbi:MAG: muconolactone Delta-isomerase family protein [Candidatus Baltobacteraceae bacterium]